MGLIMLLCSKKVHKVLPEKRGPIQGGADLHFHSPQRDHGYGASASRDVPVYAPAFVMMMMMMMISPVPSYRPSDDDDDDFICMAANWLDQFTIMQSNADTKVTK